MYENIYENIKLRLLRACKPKYQFRYFGLPVKALKKALPFNSRSFKDSPLAAFDLMQLQCFSYCSVIKCSGKILGRPKWISEETQGQKKEEDVQKEMFKQCETQRFIK